MAMHLAFYVRKKNRFPGTSCQAKTKHAIIIFIKSSSPAVEGRFVSVAVIVIVESITNWPTLRSLIGRLAVFELQIRSDNDEPLSFDKSLVKLELHSVKLPAALHVIASSKPNPSKINSAGNAILTFCR